MNWHAVSSSALQENYELKQNGKKLLTLEFHSSTNSARIDYAREKRVFMIRREGFRKHKVVLCNEYGIRIGWLDSDPKSDSIELNHENFHYSIRNNPQPELVIFREDIGNPLVVCGLDASNESAPVKLANGKLVPAASFSSLLLALGWYIMLPEVSKTEFEPAI